MHQLVARIRNVRRIEELDHLPALAFRQDGDTPEARKLLKAAQKANKHVPAYVTGEKFPPSEQPGWYSPGDETEALNYVGSFLAGWRSTPGAVAWLRDNTRKVTGKRRPRAPKAQGPLPRVKQRLQRLPQTPDTWQADFRQLPMEVLFGDEPATPSDAPTRS